MDSATADSQGQNVLLEPTAYAPAALLLASQAFVMLFLLSALIGLLACSYEAIANKAQEAGGLTAKTSGDKAKAILANVKSMATMFAECAKSMDVVNRCGARGFYCEGP